MFCDLFYFICHIYPPFTRKQIVPLYFERNVCSRLGVAICGVPGPPVFHIKMGASRQVPCPRAQKAKLPACSPQLPINAERQAGKLWIPFLKSFSMTRQGNEAQVYRLQIGRSNYYTLALVSLGNFDNHCPKL